MSFCLTTLRWSHFDPGTVGGVSQSGTVGEGGGGVCEGVQRRGEAYLTWEERVQR